MHACTHMNECEEPGGPARGVTMRSGQGIKGDDGWEYVGYIFRSPWEYSLKPELWLKSSKGGAELERGQLTGPERLKWAARPSHCGVNHWRRLPNQTFLLSLCWHQPWVFFVFLPPLLLSDQGCTCTKHGVFQNRWSFTSGGDFADGLLAEAWIPHTAGSHQMNRVEPQCCLALFQYSAVLQMKICWSAWN